MGTAGVLAVMDAWYAFNVPWPDVRRRSKILTTSGSVRARLTFLALVVASAPVTSSSLRMEPGISNR